MFVLAILTSTPISMYTLRWVGLVITYEYRHL